MHPSISDIGNTLLIAALVLFILYRRFRRNFGRQPLRQNRMIFRMLVLGTFCLVLLLPPFGSVKAYMAALLGAFLGLVLALYAIAHTQFEVTPEGKFYTPNGYIGMTVTALFVGRIIYRFMIVYPALHGAAQQAQQNSQLQMDPFAAYQHNPLTLGFYFLLAGYYICYYAGIINKSRSMSANDDKAVRPKLIS
jgi:membrane protein CcdC involved in cytochrome C biogenesis